MRFRVFLNFFLTKTELPVLATSSYCSTVATTRVGDTVNLGFYSVFFLQDCTILNSKDIETELL